MAWQPQRKIESRQMKDRTRARELAAEFHRRGDPIGWFEALYREAEEGKSTVPWADYHPTPHLVSFWMAHPQQTAEKSALVVGSGLGDDAEQLAAWGFRTTAFDISETAIRTTRKRFPNSSVEYHAANLLDPPARWSGNFDFVFEANTLQVLPASLRPQAMKNVVAFLRRGGLLLVVARAREPSDPEGQMPWPLTRSEIDAFTLLGLEQLMLDILPDADEPDVRRFRALYRYL
jgi:2-polyprenyl-3-methyl-5-hydroxy-6-metoxy-1,4-benzoquinol methylase